MLRRVQRGVRTVRRGAGRLRCRCSTPSLSLRRGRGSLCAALSVVPFPSTSTIVVSNVTLLATQCAISSSGNNAVASVAFVSF